MPTSSCRRRIARLCLEPVAVALLAVPATLLAQADSSYQQHESAATAARQRGEWTDYRTQILKADSALGTHPRTTVALARAELALGNRVGALSLLEAFVATGLAADLGADSVFTAGLGGQPRWEAVLAAAAANAGRILARATVAFTLPDTDFIAEDIAWDDARSRFLLSSVRQRAIIAVTRDGRSSAFVAPSRDGPLSILGLGVDAVRGRLWATAAAMPQAVGYSTADSGRAEIRRYDLASGALARRYPVPAARVAPVPGDLVVAENGDVFIGDGAAGILYVIRAARDSLEVLVPAGTFRSAQQPAVAADGRTVFVADYGRGLARVDRATGALSWVRHPRTVALGGTDGLLRVGSDLIGVQNGVEPQRVVRFVLDPNGSVTGWDLLEQGSPWMREPTHATVVDGVLYLIANSGWNAFDDSGARRPGVPLDAPRVLRIPLPAR